MADQIFEHPRLAGIYDVLDPDRSDLEPYLELAQGLGARRVLDVGCGTGVLALLLADGGVDVVGVDPAGASLDVARAKQGSSAVRWIRGDATELDPMRADLAVMTGNAAQAIIEPQDWAATLNGVREALKPTGRFVFKTRVPARKAWEDWNEAATRKTTTIPGVGAVESWVETLDVSLPLVTFRWTYIFDSDGECLTSDSTLRFRDRDEVEADLAAHGFAVDQVRDAPDRPGREYVFIAVKNG